MASLPEPLRLVADELARLPGLGPKSALRIALHLLKEPPEASERLGQGVLDMRRKLNFCDCCLSLSDQPTCALCADPTRDDEQLMVVAEWDSLLAIEEGGFFKGRYFVLGGLLAPLENVQPSNLEFDKLEKRLAQGEVHELILALGSTMDAEVTATYIKEMVDRRFSGLKVTRLAQGIPLGAQVKYMDKETLRQSLTYRQDV